MATSDIILSIVASEQGYLASILSAEVVKADRVAHWISLIADESVQSESDWNSIVSKAVAMEGALSDVVNSAANKEIAIAAKVAAVMGNTVGSISWGPPSNGSSDCC